MESTFTLNTKSLKQALSSMKRVAGKSYNNDVLKISVLPDKVEIAIQGVIKFLTAKTEGFADIFIPTKVLEAYMQTTSTASISFIFKEGEMQCGSSIYNSKAIRVETIFSNPDNDLPLNTNNLVLLRYAENNTENKIEKLGLTNQIRNAKRQLTTNINNALKHLSKYEVSYDELHNIIYKKIKPE
ncbi:MAG: hypothetical protein KGZ59_06805 [Chitinophagaceae bacterium]|nr:hypothetical protein [Chitinophagaceae bacterium]